MHPSEIVWESEGCSAPLWHPRWTDRRFFARATRQVPAVRDPNSGLRGRELLSPPTVYRIYEMRFNGIERIADDGTMRIVGNSRDLALQEKKRGHWHGDVTRRLKDLRDFPHLGPFEFLAILSEYEPHPLWQFDLTPTERA